MYTPTETTKVTAKTYVRKPEKLETQSMRDRYHRGLHENRDHNLLHESEETREVSTNATIWPEPPRIAEETLGENTVDSRYLELAYLE